MTTTTPALARLAAELRERARRLGFDHLPEIRELDRQIDASLRRLGVA